MVRRFCTLSLGSAVALLGLLTACSGIKDDGAGANQRGTGGFRFVVGGSSQPIDAPVRTIGSGDLTDAACASTSQSAQLVPLDLYIMMDSSGSMGDTLTATSTTTKWTAVRSALTSFLQDSRSAGLGVGLQYFPQVEAGAPATCASDAECGTYGPCTLLKTCSQASTVVQCATDADCGPSMGTCTRLGSCLVSGSYCAPTGNLCSANARDVCTGVPGNCVKRDKCDAASYATPSVEVAPLPGAAATLVASLNRHMPDGLTPTSGALAGAIQHAQALARANPAHKVVVLLATDGLPSECTPNDIDQVAAIAAAARTASPAISTYVIGVFSDQEAADAQSNLNKLATAGGTGTAFLVNTNATNVTQSFVNALNSIRSAGLSCQYMVPAGTTDGGQVDYFSVNVQFTSGAGETSIIGNVKDRASCSPTKGGWYYDVDPATGAIPKTISMCDTTCQQLTADTAGKVDILLGCTTIIIVG